MVWCGVAETLSACSLFPLLVSEAGVLTGQQASGGGGCLAARLSNPSSGVRNMCHHTRFVLI